MTEAELRELLETTRYLKARQDILDLIMREARARDRQDVDQIASCYWPEGFDEHGPSICPAPKYPEKANAGHAAFFAATSHNITNHLCQIEGDTAWCESYVVGGLLTKDESLTRIALGRYIDQVERRANENGGAEWRILNRRCTVEIASEGSAQWLHDKAVKGFLRGEWSKQDPSYLRPVVIDGPGKRW